jgi:5-formyltetrahydrofolate cyclo-ligase
MDKKTLRHTISEKKRSLSEAQIVSKSEVLAQKLFKTKQYQQAESLYAYMSFNQEVRTITIIERAWEDGKRVAVPKIIGRDMVFIWIFSFEHLLPQGACRIPEPVKDGPVADDQSALIIMPGLAFDLAGHRVGYGGGFYDRFLEREPNHPRIALCFDFQLVDQIEAEAHDVLVDQVITDA